MAFATRKSTVHFNREVSIHLGDYTLALAKNGSYICNISTILIGWHLEHHMVAEKWSLVRPTVGCHAMRVACGQ
jgi:hypothetical protein